MKKLCVLICFFLGYYICFGENNNQTLVCNSMYFYSEDSLTISELVAIDSLFVDNLEELSLSKKTKGFLYSKICISNQTNSGKVIFAVDGFEQAWVSDSLPVAFVHYIGNFAPMNQRVLKNGKHHYCILNVPSGLKKAYYLTARLSDRKFSKCEISLSTMEDYEEKEPIDNLLGSITIGVILLMSILSFGAFLIFKEKYFLLYGLTVLLWGCILSMFAGIFFRLIYPNCPEFIRYEIFIYGSLYGFLYSQFTRSFLKTKNHLPIIDKILNYLSFLIFIAPVLEIFKIGTHEFRLSVIDLFGMLIVTTILVVAISNFIKKMPQPVAFLIGNMIFCCSTVYFLLVKEKLIPELIVKEHVLHISGILEMICFAIALGMKVIEIKSNLVIEQKKTKALKSKIITEQIKEGVLFLNDNKIELSLSEIIYLKSNDNYVLIYSQQHSRPFIERMTLSKGCEKLPQSHFIRIHRTTVINTAQVIARPTKYELKMKNNEVLKVSKSYIKSVDDIYSIN